MSNITTATFEGNGRKAQACPLFQYDYGQILKVEGLTLPPSYEVDFANEPDRGTAITMLGDSDGVEIPNQFLQTGDYVYAWIVLHEGEDDRETEYMVVIPVIRRAQPSDEEPTPAQMTIIEQMAAEVTELKMDLSGWGSDTKLALLNAFAHVAWTDEHGQDYYDALEEALYAEEPPTPPTPATLVSISAEYTPTFTVYPDTSLDDLKTDIVVTATYDDSSTEVVTAYTLSGSLTVGENTITVAYEGKTDTISVTVTNFLYAWDFKTSLVDTVGGSETFVNSATVSGGTIARDSSGLKFTSSDSTGFQGNCATGNAFITVGSAWIVTVKFGATNAKLSKNTDKEGYVFAVPVPIMWYETYGRFVAWTNNAGMIDIFTITDKDFFSNKTIITAIDADGSFTIYADGEVIGTAPAGTYTASKKVGFGSGGSKKTFGDMVIESVTVKAG